MELITIMIVIGSIPFIYFIFSNHNARPEYFFLGIMMCLILESIIISIYCFYKLQRTYRLSKVIQIFKQLDSDIKPQIDYPFLKFPQLDQFYFNKYTEEARLFAKKKQLKIMADPVEQYFQETELDGEPRKATMFFLKQIRGYYNTLNRFNSALVVFGRNIKKIQEEGFFKKKQYFFPQFQLVYPSQIILPQLMDEQKDIIYRTKTRIKFRKDTQKLLFPNWMLVMNALKFIAEEFAKIEVMRQSNSQMLQMIHKKVLEDYEFIENKIVELKKNLEQVKHNKYELNKDYKRYQAEEINENNSNEPHVQMRFWIKRKIYEFRDLERRIRQNERDEANYIRKLKYYKEKLSSFSDQNKRKYMKILKTRFIAFLDSYYITVDESIKKIQQIFNIDYPYEVSRPPKVSKLKVTKNINDAIKNEKDYQKEYFERVKFYQQKLDGFIKSLETMSQFLTTMTKIFERMLNSLKNCQQNQEKSMVYFTKLFKHMIFKSDILYKQISKLVEVNQKMMMSNLPQLLRIKSKFENKAGSARDLLEGIVIEETPLQYRYQFIKSQLENHYKSLEQSIEKVKQFQKLYLTHSSRVKKILLISLISYLNFQKGSLKFGQIDEKNISETEHDIMEDNAPIPEEFNEDQNDITGQLPIEKGDSLQSGFGMSKTHVKLVNQFLFVAYTEWKQSDFFKKTISEELYIVFNSEPNENFSNVQVDSMQFSGAPPEIVWIKQLKSEEQQLFIDVHLAFKGKIEVNLKTLLKIFRSNWNISVKATFQDFYCVMRLCFVPHKHGKGWFSFIGEPVSKIDISLRISDFSFEQEPVKNLFANFLNNKLKKFTYPVKQSIHIPVSRKNQQLGIIKKRLKLLQSEREL